MRLKDYCIAGVLLAIVVNGAWAAPPKTAAASATSATRAPLQLPYAKAGMTKKEAAMHLLSRLTFGPQRREVDFLVYSGLESWLDAQLQGDLPEKELDERLKAYPSLAMSDRDIALHYLEGNQMRDRAVAEGGFKKLAEPATPEVTKAYNESVNKWCKEHGIHPMNDLRNDLLAQKLVRSVYARNQLNEVLTDFWFNHFNTSYNTGARPYVLSYERDAIRPNALGHFETLLMATAKHPAMLAYLNNAQSVANPDVPTTLELRENKPNKGRRAGKNGLNENYGREVMELHTLGVDGGYAQKDVTEVARALTGWTIMPMSGNNRQKLEEHKVPGAIIEGDFLFRAEAHDAGPKTILGRKFPQGGGLEEGEAVLEMLAAHPSTAHFVCKELAVRFVSDTPPESLVKRMADTFQRTGGDTREVMRTLVQSPEFWAPAARTAKIKSPFELVVSSLRALDAELQPDNGLYGWIERMGQPIYTYAAPTGFPDSADAWVNSGTLTHRMNYSLTLTGGRIKGVKVDLMPLQGLVPSPAERELERVGRLLMPGRDLTRTLEELRPLVNDPELARKVAEASNKNAMDTKKKTPPPPKAAPFNQVVGVLIGSPEFQRR